MSLLASIPADVTANHAGTVRPAESFQRSLLSVTLAGVGCSTRVVADRIVEAYEAGTLDAMAAMKPVRA